MLQTHLNPWLTRYAGLSLFDLQGASGGWEEWGRLHESILRHCMVGLIFWIVCLWMYRQKIFVRI